MRRAHCRLEVVDQPVQRRSRHSGHVLHASQHRRRTGGRAAGSSYAACFTHVRKDVPILGRRPSLRSGARRRTTRPNILPTVADLVPIEEIRAAALAIADHVVRTPTVASAGMTALLGVPTTLKLELLQRSGSFKARGVANKLLTLSAAERDAGVVAVSGGNHGIAVAEVAGGMDIQATVVMARSAPPRSIERIRAAGADLRLTEDMGKLLQELVDEPGRSCTHSTIRSCSPGREPSASSSPPTRRRSPTCW